MNTINDLLKIKIFQYGDFILTVNSILNVALIFLVTWFVLWLVRKFMFLKPKRKIVDTRNLHSLYQIIKYVLYIVAIALALEQLGVKITVLIAGSAALIVGIGLGLQQTFNDFISGIILLAEGTTKVGDVLEVEGDVIKIQSIGLRTSKGLNRDEIVVIIPNSLITTNRVINWSHQSEKTRFRIQVGVAYGSDVELVIKILKESALEHPDVSDRSSLEARFIDFGNSSLDFEILFYSENIFRIEKVKSDIRKIIYRKFLENHVTIPFPQVDVHIKPTNPAR